MLIRLNVYLISQLSEYYRKHNCNWEGMLCELSYLWCDNDGKKDEYSCLYDKLINVKIEFY